MTTISCIDGIYRISVKYGTQPATHVVLHIRPENIEDDFTAKRDHHDWKAIKAAEERFPELAPFVIG